MSLIYEHLSLKSTDEKKPFIVVNNMKQLLVKQSYRRNLILVARNARWLEQALDEAGFCLNVDRKTRSVKFNAMSDLWDFVIAHEYGKHVESVTLRPEHSSISPRELNLVEILSQWVKYVPIRHIPVALNCAVSDWATVNSWLRKEQIKYYRFNSNDGRVNIIMDFGRLDDAIMMLGIMCHNSIECVNVPAIKRGSPEDFGAPPVVSEDKLLVSSGYWAGNKKVAATI